MQAEDEIRRNASRLYVVELQQPRNFADSLRTS
jgi:hypothetical protein